MPLLTSAIPLVSLLGLYVVYRVIDRVIRWPKVRRYSQRYVLVTGSGRGFGFRTCVQLDRLGCHVIAGCHSDLGQEELRRECSDRLTIIRLDVSSPESVREAFQLVKSIIPPGRGLWGLVNNAGVGGPRGRLEWATLDDYRFVMQVNLYGMVDMTTTFLPLIKKEKGRVINTCSMAGRLAIPDAAPYTASKFAAEAFSDTLRRSIAIYGCKVSIIEPGGFKTELNTSDIIRKAVTASFNGASKELQEEFGEEYLENTIRSMQKIKQDQNLDEVIGAYEDGLFCRYPRARYVLGSQGRLAALIPPLPEWLADWVIEYFRGYSTVLPAALKNRRG